MNSLLAALAALGLLAGVTLVLLGWRGSPTDRPSSRLADGWRRRTAGWGRGRRAALVASLIGGAAVWALSGWLVAGLAVPAAALGLPSLLRPRSTTASIEQLDAMEEWTRGLGGVLTAGIGLEEALKVSARSAPSAIKRHVSLLGVRLQSGWDVRVALRAYADDLNDATGDLIAASLIAAATLRGPKLAQALEGIADTVSEEVRMRRAIEADRAKPRTEARVVTLLIVGIFALMFLANGDYMAPYRTPTGQVILTLLLVAFVGLLVWMKRMAQDKPLPRFLVASRQDRSGRAWG